MRLFSVLLTFFFVMLVVGIGKTVKEKVCVHTSRDIRAIASQLVNVWLEVFRKEKASSGGLKFSRQSGVVDTSRRKSSRDAGFGKPPLHTNHGALESRGNLQVSVSHGSHLSSSASAKKVNGKQVKVDSAFANMLDVEVEETAVMTEEEKAAFAAAEAAHAAALAAAEVCYVL